MKTRSDNIMLAAACLAAGVLWGCWSSGGEPPAVPGLLGMWGSAGRVDGTFVKPRVVEVVTGELLCVIDRSGRVQFFDLSGRYVQKFEIANVAKGYPTGMTAARDGTVWIAETHAYRVASYTTGGEELFAFGSMGDTDGHFVYVTDVAVGHDGSFYVSDFGTVGRVQRFDPKGGFIRSWGTMGTEPGQFNRPQALAICPDGSLLVADACNDRVQKFTPEGEFIASYGTPGDGEGQLRYPYDLAVSPDGIVYIAEYGNCRVQRMTVDGAFLGTWGRRGSGPGELAQPWGVSLSADGRLFILDTGNSRVVAIDPAAAEWSQGRKG